ncbi:hypothetical protein [Lentzea sp. CA-135723]|uniref:hypothetical protein n=1 Tax=Lentzea sp. CA-135723 TaxID=3239950 RepID=UPI003D8AAB14
MGIFGGRTVARLRAKATTEHQRFEAAVRANDLAEALRHSELLEKTITELTEREPGEAFHRFQLAGVQYNRATVLDALGRGDEAVAAAQSAVRTYAAFDPTTGDPAAVARQLREMRADGIAAEILIRNAADAAARLARLLAKYEGKARDDAPLDTYEQLREHGDDTTQADVDRIAAQQAAAEAHLRKPPLGTQARPRPAGRPRTSPQLKANQRALDQLERQASHDPVARVANQPAIARLHYDAAALHNNIGNGPQAVESARAAEFLYTDLDPTHGDPSRVEATVQRFRREHPESVREFEELIGNAANARSQLAWMLACHHGRSEAATVERLATNAIRTYERLILVSRQYGPDDLRLVSDQVTQAYALLRR